MSCHTRLSECHTYMNIYTLAHMLLRSYKSRNDKNCRLLGIHVWQFQSLFCKMICTICFAVMVGSYCADAWSVFLFTHSHRNAWNYDTCEMADGTVCCSSTKGSTKVKRNCLMKALHSCEFLEDCLKFCWICHWPGATNWMAACGTQKCLCRERKFVCCTTLASRYHQYYQMHSVANVGV